MRTANKPAAWPRCVRKHDEGEGVGDEYESLAALDRRIAETRARVAWFEAAAEGNALPRAEHW